MNCSCVAGHQSSCSLELAFIRTGVWIPQNKGISLTTFPLVAILSTCGMFFGDSRPWVATRYCQDQSVVTWSWSSWNVLHSRMNEWKDKTSQMPGGHSSQQWYEDRRSTCKDRFERTRPKMCRHQLNEWAWKNDEKVRQDRR